MISPDTPPGTEIICIDASAGPYGPVGLALGEIYTIERIESALYDGHVVLLSELPHSQAYEPPWGQVTIGFNPRRFRYLDVPDSLVALLHKHAIAMEIL